LIGLPAQGDDPFFPEIYHSFKVFSVQGLEFQEGTCRSQEEMHSNNAGICVFTTSLYKSNCSINCLMYHIVVNNLVHGALCKKTAGSLPVHS